MLDFCQQAERQIAQEEKLEKNALPPRFIKVSQALWQGKWFEHYVQIENINYSLQRIASRSPRMAPLAETGQTLLDNYDLFAAQFSCLYQDLLEKTASFHENR